MLFEGGTYVNQLTAPPLALERAAHGEAESIPLAREEDAGKLFRYPDLRIGIIKIDQAKRHINDRKLPQKFKT